MKDLFHILLYADMKNPLVNCVELFSLNTSPLNLNVDYVIEADNLKCLLGLLKTTGIVFLNWTVSLNE